MGILVLGIGFCLVFFLLIQAFLLTISTGMRLRADALDRRLSLREWQYRMKAAELRVTKAAGEKDQWSGWRKFEVRRKQFENEAHDICSFYLYPHDRRPLPPFRPGQFLMIKAEIPDPEDPYATIEETRCYSLSDSHNPRYYRISVKAVPPPPKNPDFPPGRVSNHLHQHIEVGTLIDVMAPSGEFCVDTESSSPVVLIAGGVGVTPILCMLNSIVDRRLPRETWVFYGIRGPQELILSQTLRHAVEHMPSVRIVLCYSEQFPEKAEEVRGLGTSSLSHHFGFVALDLFQRHLPSNNYDFYICGPPGMMAALEKALLGWGVPGHHIHYELFAPAPATETPAARTDDGKSFQVRFVTSEKELQWAGEGNIMLLTQKSKLNIRRIKYGCKQGKCGICETAVRAGAVLYPGGPPTHRVKESHCLPCICVPASNLELEA